MWRVSFLQTEIFRIKHDWACTWYDKDRLVGRQCFLQLWCPELSVFSTWQFPVVCLLFQSYCVTSSEFAPISVTQVLFSWCTLSFTERGSLSNILQRHINSMQQHEAVFSCSKLTAEASNSTLRCRDPGSPVCTTEVHFQCELQPFAEAFGSSPRSSLQCIKVLRSIQARFSVCTDVKTL